MIGSENVVGAHAQAGGGVLFRVWAPAAARVQVEVLAHAGNSGEVTDLHPEADGYHFGVVASAAPGSRYRFRLPNGIVAPDPSSRFQPEGPEGPSEVVDPARFAWTDGAWAGIRSRAPVLYELHPGTFTPEGTWAAARARLTELRELGIDAIEVMPVAEFAGAFGWGYDGVQLSAPYHLYGTPDEFRAFVDQAHAFGIGVVLDVVYNHYGPGAEFLKHFSPDYYSHLHTSEWGACPNFDGEHSGPVRRLFVDNVTQWIRDFHLDGLRFDATQQLFDDSRPHILAEMTQAARVAAGSRRLHLSAENEPQDGRLLRPLEEGGCGIDAIWNEDYFRSATIALTGRGEAYYTDSRGTAQELISCLKYGPLFQGQTSRWQKQPRGHRALDVPPRHWILFLQNHDQVANSLKGDRVDRLTSPAALRAGTALTLLAPSCVLLFQGQEFAASAPFTYFADHRGELAQGVAKGRREFLAQFPSVAAVHAETPPLDPADPRQFERCKLTFSERMEHHEIWQLHRDLLRLRQEDPAITECERCDGAVLGPLAFVLRYFSAECGDRLLIANLGADVLFEPVPEPLLAPPENGEWRIAWSSDAPIYGGQGAFLRPTPGGWFIPGRIAAFLVPDDSPSRT